jgi:hypothetical protein
MVRRCREEHYTGGVNGIGVARFDVFAIEANPLGPRPGMGRATIVGGR